MVFLPLLGFVFVTLLVTAGAMALSPAVAGQVEQRLAEIGGVEAVTKRRSGQVMLDGLKRLGRVAPRSPSEMGRLQQRLVSAGYRSNEALIVFFGIRIGLALLLFALLALPAALGVALSFISPDHMNTLFTQPLGRTMLLGAAVMQTVGYFWIRQVIRIEV